MSHAYDTRTFTVPSEKLPSSYSSLEDLESFEAETGNVSFERTDGLHYVAGSTRSGWAIYVMRNMLQAAPEFTALQFLTDKGHTYTFETEYQRTSVSVLDPADVDAAAAQLEHLVAVVTEDPMRAYDADEAGVFSDPGVEEAIRRDYVSASPAHDNQVVGDEGEGADYLFTYLRSILALLRAAQKEGSSVVHTLVI